MTNSANSANSKLFDLKNTIVSLKKCTKPHFSLDFLYLKYLNFFVIIKSESETTLKNRKEISK
jgi:hypothetical protein